MPAFRFKRRNGLEIPHFLVREWELEWERELEWEWEREWELELEREWELERY